MLQEDKKKNELPQVGITISMEIVWEQILQQLQAVESDERVTVHLHKAGASDEICVCIGDGSHLRHSHLH